MSIYINEFNGIKSHLTSQTQTHYDLSVRTVVWLLYKVFAIYGYRLSHQNSSNVEKSQNQPAQRVQGKLETDLTMSKYSIGRLSR